MAPAAKRQKLEGAPRRALTKRAQAANGNGAFRPAEKRQDEPVSDDGGDDGADGLGSGSDADVATQKPGASYSTLLQSLGANNSTSTKTKRKRKQDRLEAAPDSDAELDQALADDEQLYDNRVESEAQGAESETDPFAVADEESAVDPFEMHFAHPDEEDLALRLAAIKKRSWRKENLAVSGLDGKATVELPHPSAATLVRPLATSDLAFMNLKQRLREPAQQARSSLNPLHFSYAGNLSTYSSLLFPARTPANAEGFRTVNCLHSLNHIFKTRDRVLKNNARLAHQAANPTSLDDDPDRYRDQGFTRPKVLFLLETRQAAVRYLASIAQLAEADQQENRKRFEEQFVRPDEDEFPDKPDDFRELFSGNDDNDFRIGVKLTRKTLKYFAQFYNSDIILASPLGLRRAIRADDRRKFDADFLSSVEIVVVDQADAMLMQNWDHVLHVFSHLNCQPRETHGCDFSRVRKWCLDGHAKQLRQTIVLSAYATPELNGLFQAEMGCIAGRVRIQPRYTGSMLEAAVQVRQTFQRFQSKTPASEADERFAFFTRAVVPSLARLNPQEGDASVGALVFVPSYLDFVRVRNYFAGDAAVNHLSFGAVSEYTPVPDIKRARSHFLSGRYSILLYSGRAHHFRRYLIRGVKRVILYSVPENPLFYNEIVSGFLGQSIYTDSLLDASEAQAKCLFSKWEGLALERIVGTERVGRMLKDEGDVFDFR